MNHWTRAVCILIGLSTASIAPAATTVLVENRSFTPVSLTVERWPHGQTPKLAPQMVGYNTDKAWKRGVKLLAAPNEAERQLISLVYLDTAGQGCRFRTVPVRHTHALVKIVPVAEPVGARRCEATTGATIGDFIFTLK